jgi:hypothetical protein
MDRIVVAWDFGRPAARALADAIPLLQRATQIRVITVVTDKLLGASGNFEQYEEEIDHRGPEHDFPHGFG